MSTHEEALKAWLLSSVVTKAKEKADTGVLSLSAMRSVLLNITPA